MLDDLIKISTDALNKFDNLEHISDQSSNLKNKYVKLSKYSNQAEKSEKRIVEIINFEDINNKKINDSRINNINYDKTLVRQKRNKVMDIINK